MAHDSPNSLIFPLPKFYLYDMCHVALIYVTGPAKINHVSAEKLPLPSETYGNVISHSELKILAEI